MGLHICAVAQSQSSGSDFMGYGEINHRGRGLRSSAEGRAQRVVVFSVSSVLSAVFPKPDFRR